MTRAHAPWDMAEWPVRAQAWTALPDGPAERAAGAAAAAAIATALVEHGPLDLSPLPPTLRETWHLEEPLLALEVKYVSEATPERMTTWLHSRGFERADAHLGLTLSRLWADHVHRWVLPELAGWLERTPGPVDGGDLLVDAAAVTWPLLDSESAGAVLRAAAAVDPVRGRQVAAEVLRVPAASWPVRRAVVDILRGPQGEPSFPCGAAVLVAPATDAVWARTQAPDVLRSWLAQVAADASAGVGLDLGVDGGYALAEAVAAGREGAGALVVDGESFPVSVRRGQHGVGLWIEGVRFAAEPAPGRIPLAWAAHACALAGPMLRARAALASSGPSDTVSEQLYRAEPTEWSEFTLPQALWLPWSTPAEVTDPLLERAGVKLRSDADGSVFTLG